MIRRLSEAKKKFIAGRQNFKCANNPQNLVFDHPSIPIIQNYNCPFWRNGADGSFDESQYEIDHIIEYSKSKDNSLGNLQALCKCCHAVKTRRFNITASRKKVNNIREISLEAFCNKYSIYKDDNVYINHSQCHSILCEMIGNRKAWSEFDFNEIKHQLWLRKENLSNPLYNNSTNLIKFVDFINSNSKKFFIQPEIPTQPSFIYNSDDESNTNHHQYEYEYDSMDFE